MISSFLMIRLKKDEESKSCLSNPADVQQAKGGCEDGEAEWGEEAAGGAEGGGSLRTTTMIIVLLQFSLVTLAMNVCSFTNTRG